MNIILSTRNVSPPPPPHHPPWHNRQARLSDGTYLIDLHSPTYIKPHTFQRTCVEQFSISNINILFVSELQPPMEIDSPYASTKQSSIKSCKSYTNTHPTIILAISYPLIFWKLSSVQIVTFLVFIVGIWNHLTIQALPIRTFFYPSILRQLTEHFSYTTHTQLLDPRPSHMIHFRYQ